MTTEMQTTERGEHELSREDEAKVINSLVTKGDWSGLGAEARVRAYNAVCAQHGLNPLSQPFAFLRLNGKEVLYATRGATDQLARTHRVNRKIIDGPKIVDIAGTKVAFCVAEGSTPDGRIETSTATLPVQDPLNLYMKLETKAKRRVTLSILGLGVLDETELDTIPASAMEDVGQPSPQGPALSDLAVSLVSSVAELATADAVRTLWHAHLPRWGAESSLDHKAVWKACVERVIAVGGGGLRSKTAASNYLRAKPATDILQPGVEIAEATAVVEALPTLETAEAKRDPFATVARHADDADGDGVIAQVVQAIRAAGTLTGGDKQALWNAALDCLAAFEIANAEARLRAALQPPTPDGNGGGRSRAKASGANAQGAGSEGAANTQGAPQASVRVVPDGEHLDATARDAEQALVVDALAWERHLAETVARKLADPKAKDPHLAVRCALAQGYANRRFDFTKAGGQKLREERHDATVRAMRPYGGDDASNTALVAKKCGTTYGTVDENVLTMRRPSQAAGLAPTGTGD